MDARQAKVCQARQFFETKLLPRLERRGLTQVVAAAVGGSVALGLDDARSDVDLDVLLPEEASEAQWQALVSAIRPAAGGPICVQPKRLGRQRLAPRHAVEYFSRLQYWELAAVDSYIILYDPCGWLCRFQEALRPERCPQHRWRAILEGELLWLIDKHKDLSDSLARQDRVTAFVAAGQFAESALNLCYLFARRFPLSHKWVHRGVHTLGEYAARIEEHIGKLIRNPFELRHADAVLRLCRSEAQGQRCWPSPEEGQ